MVSPGLLPWLFAVALAAVHFLGEELDDITFAHQPALTSFTTGVTITYVFLQLLPEHHRGVAYLGEFGFLFGLLGFSMLHLAKKGAYTHGDGVNDIRHQFKEIHTIFLASYHFALGLLLQLLTEIGAVDGLLFFLPVLLHTGISSLSLTELHEEVLDRTWVKAAVAASPVLGVAFGALGLVSMPLFHAILGTVTGMFLYVVIHDALPQQGEGRPWFYVAGMMVYSGLIVATWIAV